MLEIKRGVHKPCCDRLIGPGDQISLHAVSWSDSWLQKNRISNNKFGEHFHGTIKTGHTQPSCSHPDVMDKMRYIYMREQYNDYIYYN